VNYDWKSADLLGDEEKLLTLPCCSGTFAPSSRPFPAWLALLAIPQFAVSWQLFLFWAREISPSPLLCPGTPWVLSGKYAQPRQINLHANEGEKLAFKLHLKADVCNILPQTGIPATRQK
jgi:hypothetical protein